MKKLILLAVLAAQAAVPAQADELWCMPDQICIDDTCKPNTDTEASLRLHDRDGPNPVMRAYAEDIAMTKTNAANPEQWSGVTSFGTAETLQFTPADMRFTLLTHFEENEVIATGRCELQ